MNRLNETIQKILFDIHTAEGERKAATETSLSKVGAKRQRIFKKKLKSKLRKRQQNNLDFIEKPVYNYSVSLDGTLPKPTPVSACKKIENKYHISSEALDEDHLF